MNNAKLIEQLKEKFKEEDDKSWCSKCHKPIKTSPYCWERHYEEHHPEVKPEDYGFDMGYVKGWTLFDIVRVLDNFNRKIKKK